MIGSGGFTIGRRLAAAAALGALCAGGALAQETPDNGAAAIGPPQLRDFSLTPRERIVTQPQPQAQPAPAAPEPARAAPQRSEPSRPETAARTEPRAAPERPASTPAPAPAARAQAAEPPAAPVALPSASSAAPPAFPLPVDSPLQPSLPAAATAEEGGLWYYAFPAAALALLGGGVAIRRRRRLALAGGAMPALELSPRDKAKPEIERMPRPWLEIELEARRTAVTAEEATIDFELALRNTGKADARNVRITARIFNAGAEQDKEIGAFFKDRGEGRRSFTVPHIPQGVDGKIAGVVALPAAELRAVRMNERLLFIPVVGVNVVYDYGDGRTGQTSKSYLVGRDLGEEADKMGPFRLDRGPRVWRNIAQRTHRLARRV